MKKTWILLGLTLVSLAVLTACTSNADTMQGNTATTRPSSVPTQTTSPTTSLSPAVTYAPAATDNMTGGMTTGASTGMQEGGVNTVEDARRVSGKVDDEVEKLSEIDDAEAVVAGNIALVAVKYDKQYQGGLTERLISMINERVEMADKAITAVHATDDQNMVSRISNLHEKLEEDQLSFEELQTQVLEIGSAISGGGTPDVTQPQSNTQG